MEYSSVSSERFLSYRQGLRETMREKSLSEIRAMRSVLYKLKAMSAPQIQLLIDDLALMEAYKSKSHSWRDEFDKMMGAA